MRIVVAAAFLVGSAVSVAHACILCDMPACGAKISVCQQSASKVEICFMCPGMDPACIIVGSGSTAGYGVTCGSCESAVIPCFGATWGSVDSCSDLCNALPI